MEGPLPPTEPNSIPIRRASAPERTSTGEAGWDFRISESLEVDGGLRRRMQLETGEGLGRPRVLSFGTLEYDSFGVCDS